MDCVEFVHLRLVSGMIEDLRRLRPLIVADFESRYDAKAELFELEDKTFLDVWRWESRTDADEALADPTISPEFQQRQQLVEVLSVKWAVPVSA